MAKSKSPAVDAPPVKSQASELAEALRDVIQSVKPPEKKSIFTRKQQTPWSPPDGVAKLKLKRKLYHHGLLVNEDFMSNEEVGWANKIRPGLFFDGWVKVTRRRDKGIDVDYNVRSPQQRLKLPTVHGVRNFSDLLRRLTEEAEAPKKSEFEIED
jgi:hypothetical protein